MSRLIMVVNHDTELLELLKDLLEEEGFRVSLHHQNMHDLKKVKEVGPELVIIDQLHTAERTGWQLIQKMRLDPETTNIPIILCSTEVQVIKGLEEQLSKKNVRTVFKPFDIDDLLNEVNASFNNTAGLTAMSGGYVHAGSAEK